MGPGRPDDVLARVATGEAPGDAWAHLPARRFFQELAGEVIGTSYGPPHRMGGDEFQLLEFVRRGFITGPGGEAFGSTGIVVNCPIVMRFL